MKRKRFLLATSLIALACAMAALLWATSPARAAQPEQAPTVTEVSPTSAPNDLDTTAIITGANFAAVPTVTLGTTVLDEVGWVSAERLTATVPWGLDPVVYTVTVQNPDGSSAILPDAFTLTQGIGVWNAGEIYGGEMAQVASHPGRDYPIYAVSDQVGLFRREGSAVPWEFLFPGEHLKLAVSPADPDRLFLNAGYRSDDGGDTWSPIARPPNYERLYPHPTSPDTVFANNSLEDTGPGLWKSPDGGQTWNPAMTGLTDTQVADLTFHPDDPITMAVGTSNGNVFVSDDGGDAWFLVGQPTNSIEMLTFAPLADHELWASAYCLGGATGTYWTTSADYRTWERLSDPVGSGSVAHAYFGEINWGEAYSQTAFVAMCFGDTYESDDDGVSWSGYGINAKDLALHASDPDGTYAAHPSDGIYQTENGGGDWRPINEGLTGVAPDDLTASSRRPDVVLAVDTTSEQTGIYRATRGGATWQYDEISDLDASTLLGDPFGSDHIYAAGRAWSATGARVCTSDDGGESWLTPCNPITAPVVYSDTRFEGLVLGATDPKNPGTLLAGAHHYRLGFPVFHAGSIYKSTDSGQSWSWIDVGEPISPVTDLAYDHLTKTVVYASTGIWGEGSGLWKSTNAGETWRRIGEEYPALDFVVNLAVEPKAPYRIFAQPGNPGEGFYVSEDHGLNWHETEGWEWWGNTHELLVAPRTAVFYAATGQGLMASTNGGQSWDRAAGALGRVPVYSLAAVTDTERVFLYAGTTGGQVQSRQGEYLIQAGVYRYTTIQPDEAKIYLPMVLRQSP